MELSSEGGREWFILSTKQAIELCIFIQQYPHIELSEKVIIKDLLERQLMWKKTVEKKMDIIINNYQKAAVKMLRQPTSTEDEEQPNEPAVEYDPDRETYEKAIALVIEEGKASTSLLQRRLGLGYSRAARIIDQLEENRINH